MIEWDELTDNEFFLLVKKMSDEQLIKAATNDPGFFYVKETLRPRVKETISIKPFSPPSAVFTGKAGSSRTRTMVRAEVTESVSWLNVCRDCGFGNGRHAKSCAAN